MTTVRVACGILFAAAIILSPSCTANKKPSSIEKSLADAVKDVVIPVEAHRLKNLIPSSDEAIQAGRQIYLESCSLCHGGDGHGSTNLGRGMYPPAMDLTSPHVQRWTDADLFWIVENGIAYTGMPSWKSSISATDTWKLAHFIHSLQARNVQTPPAPPDSVQQKAGLITDGKTLYRQEGCFTCHTLDGQGGQIGPDLTIEGTRHRTDAWLIGHFGDPPAYTSGSIMPPFGNLMPAQLQALTVFLQNQKAPGK